MDRALELIDYYSDHPPTHIILGLVHLKQKPARMRQPVTESSAMGQMRELSGLLGQQAEQMPDYLRHMAKEALAEASRLRN